MRCPAQGAADSWVMPGLGSSGRPSWEFSLINTPWEQGFTSPGQCSGLAAPTPEAQARSLAGEPRFRKMFVMALKGFKRNTQKQKIKPETEDEPQTSGKCKIRPRRKNNCIHTDNQNSSYKTKHKEVTWQTKKTENNVDQLKTKLTKTYTKKQDQ